MIWTRRPSYPGRVEVRSRTLAHASVIALDERRDRRMAGGSQPRADAGAARGHDQAGGPDPRLLSAGRP
jgi:hypothetical protein